MKKYKISLLILLIILIPVVAFNAENYINVTNIFVAHTLLQASQVNMNFQDIIEGLNGGTKTINVGKVLIDGKETLFTSGSDNVISTNVLVVDGVTLNGSSSPGDIPWTNYSASSTIGGIRTSDIVKQIMYRKVDDIVFCNYYLYGVGLDTRYITFTMPYYTWDTIHDTILPSAFSNVTAYQAGKYYTFMSPSTNIVSICRIRYVDSWYWGTGVITLKGRFWYRIR